MQAGRLWRALRRFFFTHPIGRRNRWATLARVLRWQVGSRVLGVPVAIPFVNGTKLLMQTGMHGATGNAYVGLMEFEDMAFFLHLLNEDDCFVDVGANVGVYSVLAASRGARVTAIEPVPGTYQKLLDNVYVNRFNTLIQAINIGISSTSGELAFSTELGPTNHVVLDRDASGDIVSVPVDRLDNVLDDATAIKIDVEGFESEVIAGATRLLKNKNLKAMLIELNGLGSRYGFKDDNVHAQLLEFGFIPVSYDPFKRELVPIEGHGAIRNTLYVREIDDLRRRLTEARQVAVCGVTF